MKILIVITDTGVLKVRITVQQATCFTDSYSTEQKIQLNVGNVCLWSLLLQFLSFTTQKDVILVTRTTSVVHLIRSSNFLCNTGKQTFTSL